MSVTAFKPLKERNPGPYGRERQCECGARLSSYNPGPLCAPCQGGDWHSEEELSSLQTKRLATQRLEDRLAA